MRKSRLFLILLSVVIVFLIAGCGGNQIQLEPVDPIVSHINAQALDLRNCGNRNELKKSLASEVQVKYEIQIHNDGTANGDEDNILDDNLRKKLENQIEKNYRAVYDAAVSEVKDIILTIPANEVHTFNINWDEKLYESKIYYQTGDMTYSWLYSYRLEIPKLGDIWVTGCTA